MREITKNEAKTLLGLAEAVILDDLGVCYFNLPDEEDGDVWFEASIDTSEGLLYEFNVDALDGITWDGNCLKLPFDGGLLEIKPLYLAGNLNPDGI